MIDTLLANKKILLGVTGSIAIYKSLELARLFIKAKADVYVVMSEAAKSFISPLSFEAISQNMVLHEDTQNWYSNLNHIGYARLADIFIIAPATVNTINKLANGIADSLILKTALAHNKSLIIAPAANTVMLENSVTKESLLKLASLGHKIVSSQIKELACGEFGNGAMAEPNEIFFEASRALLSSEYWKDKKVVVTGGGTIEKIDDVRFISNFSSGKMANALALALYLLGADVKIISSKDTRELPNKIKKESFESSKELFEKIQKSDFEYLFMAAAVSDFVPKSSFSGKIKKEKLDTLNLELEKNIDILSLLQKKDNQKIVGFKAELDRDNAKDSAKNMLKNKKLHAVCLNILDKHNYFGSDLNEIELFIGDSFVHIELDKKINVAFKILEALKNHDTSASKANKDC